MRQRLLTLALLCLLTFPSAAEEILVVVRASSDLASLSRNEVINVFLGRYRQLPNGQLLSPYDLAQSSWERTAFYERLLNKTPAEISAYWSRLIFSGRVTPPYTVDSSEKLIEILTSTPNAIGYLSRSKLDRRLRVVYELDAP